MENPLDRKINEEYRQRNNPKRPSQTQKRKNRLKGDEAQRRAEAQRGGERLKPEEIWPNYPNMSTSNTIRNTLAIGGAAVGGMLRGLLRISNPYGI